MGRRSGVPHVRDGIVDLGVDQELPQEVTNEFTPSSEDNVLLRAKEGNGVYFVEEYSDIVAEGANAHKVVSTVGTVLGT